MPRREVEGRLVQFTLPLQIHDLISARGEAEGDKNVAGWCRRAAYAGLRSDEKNLVQFPLPRDVYEKVSERALAEGDADVAGWCRRAAYAALEGERRP